MVLSEPTFRAGRKVTCRYRDAGSSFPVANETRPHAALFFFLFFLAILGANLEQVTYLTRGSPLYRFHASRAVNRKRSSVSQALAPRITLKQSTSRDPIRKQAAANRHHVCSSVPSSSQALSPCRKPRRVLAHFTPTHTHK